MNIPIISLAAKGDGVTADGRFVPGAIPGDLLNDDGTITPGPNRQVPPCRHFGKCGGCQLQHVTDEAYADFVVERIASALMAQGLPLPDIASPHLSPAGARRRVALRALRTGKQISLGFAEGRSHTLVNLGECPVMDPRLFALIAPLRPLLLKLLRDKRPSDIRMTIADQGIDLMLSGVRIDGLEAVEALSDFAAAHRLARLSVDEGHGPEARHEPEPVTISFGGIPVPLPFSAFLQATPDGEAALVKAAKDAVGGAKQVADLFAGLGTFTFACTGKVHAVEGARDAIVALQQAANRSRRLVTSDHRDLFRRPVTAAELAPYDAVIIDPPRTGAKEQCEQLAACTVPVIASISCNPATFARDAKILVDGGYRMEWIRPVGQFRWSTHVELAARFVRA